MGGAHRVHFEHSVLDDSMTSIRVAVAQSRTSMKGNLELAVLVKHFFANLEINTFYLQLYVSVKFFELEAVYPEVEANQTRFCIFVVKL